MHLAFIRRHIRSLPIHQSNSRKVRQSCARRVSARFRAEPRGTGRSKLLESFSEASVRCGDYGREGGKIRAGQERPGRDFPSSIMGVPRSSSASARCCDNDDDDDNDNDDDDDDDDDDGGRVNRIPTMRTICS